MGEPACFLDATCLGCGRFLDTVELEGDTCPHCGAELAPRTSPTVVGDNGHTD
jgi:rRNA maturation endonuclease Nob1